MVQHCDKLVIRLVEQNGDPVPVPRRLVPGFEDQRRAESGEGLGCTG